MPETILSKLETARKQLLDLGLRNPLLNYKIPAGKGLRIIEEKSSAVFKVLVSDGKAMSFVGQPDNNNNSNKNAEELASDESYSDLKLQTSELEKVLQGKLLKIYYAARTSIEEQGVNILYLTL